MAPGIKGNKFGHTHTFTQCDFEFGLRVEGDGAAGSVCKSVIGDA